MLSEEIKTHLTDSGQRYELLGIQIDQPGQEIISVLYRGGYTDWPWCMNQLSCKGATLDFDTMLCDNEFLWRQVEYLAGFIA